MCGAFERKENYFCELKNIIYTHDTAIKNGQVHHLKALATIPYFNFHFFSTLADIFAV